MSELQRLRRDASALAIQDTQMDLGRLGQEIGLLLGRLALSGELNEEQATSLVGHWRAFDREARAALNIPGQQKPAGKSK